MKPLKQRQIEALEKSIIHWKALVEVYKESVRIKRKTTPSILWAKEKALIKAFGREEPYPNSACFLCKYFHEDGEFHEDGKENCVDCPVKWTEKPEDHLPCVRDGSVYAEFCETVSPKAELRTAKRVLQLLKDTLKELKK